jgi:heparosan-N-sulfate-glucuronate 5-epimerase
VTSQSGRGPTIRSLARKGAIDLRQRSFPVDVPARHGESASRPMPPAAGADQALRYPVDLRPMTARFQLDRLGIVVTRSAAGTLYRNPVSCCLYALGRHTAATAAGDQPADGNREAAVSALLTQAGQLRASQDGNGGWRYAVPVPRYRVASGWYSAMAQGLAISVMLRAFSLSEEQSFLESADAAAALLLKPVSQGGCADYDRQGRPFLEECPSDPASHILNGAIFALFGLRELNHHRHDADFQPVAERLLEQLPEFDLGYWTRYDLRFAAPASFAYHSLHIALVTACGRLLADERWAGTAARWGRYARNPFRRLHAMTAKSRFVLRERRG